MTKREWMGTVFACSAAGLRGSEQFPGTTFRDYSRCLPAYLTDLAATATAKRNALLDKLTTPAAIRARQGTGAIHAIATDRRTAGTHAPESESNRHTEPVRVPN